MTNEEFKQVRIKKGYTQAELSQIIGLTIVQISRLENWHPIKKSHELAIKSIPKKK